MRGLVRVVCGEGMALVFFFEATLGLSGSLHRAHREHAARGIGALAKAVCGSARN